MAKLAIGLRLNCRTQQWSQSVNVKDQESPMTMEVRKTRNRFWKVARDHWMLGRTWQRIYNNGGLGPCRLSRLSISNKFAKIGKQWAQSEFCNVCLVMLWEFQTLYICTYFNTTLIPRSLILWLAERGSPNFCRFHLKFKVHILSCWDAAKKPGQL